MVKLPAWAHGPYELIEHAEGHYRGAIDVDRRMALVGFDNAVEVAITTYLQLNPKLRQGATYRHDDVQKWLQNYHTKIEFLERFLADNGVSLESSVAEIIWYHTLRNELYHSGNGMVPERRCLDGARDAAIEVYKVLFGIDVSSLLTASRVSHPEKKKDAQNVATIENRFFQSYIAFERALRSSAMTRENLKGGPRTARELWDIFRKQSKMDARKYDSVIEKATLARNKYAHSGIMNNSEQELEWLIDQLDELVIVIESCGYSLDILHALIERYGDWVDTLITGVRIVHKGGSAFLEVTRRASGLYDEETKRVDLDFIADGEEPLFRPTRRAQENADRFFDELDLYSIVMTGIGNLLFTSSGLDAAVELSSANGGEPKINITRRTLV